MIDFHVKKEGTGEIFENEMLELLTRTNPLLTGITYGGIITFLVAMGIHEVTLSWYYMVGLFVCGLLVWTFLEYFLHRVVFHYTSENRVWQWVHYALHGVHHEFPNDATRVFMPPVPGLILSFLLFLPFYALLGDIAFFVFAGVILGYALYSFVHYSIHQKKPPKGFEGLWKHHLVHHFQQPEKAFGVSSVFWDKLFHTMPEEGKK